MTRRERESRPPLITSCDLPWHSKDHDVSNQQGDLSSMYSKKKHRLDERDNVRILANLNTDLMVLSQKKLSSMSRGLFHCMDS